MNKMGTTESGDCQPEARPEASMTGGLGIIRVAHSKARADHPEYLEVGVHRIVVPDDKISWNVPWPEYDSVQQQPFDHPRVRKQYETKGAAGWAASPTERALVGNTKSYEDSLPSNADGEALNPYGRTGIKEGRGLLGKWGPNFAADPIIVRVDPTSGELQVLLIKRKDTGDWALPGGMADYGELAPQTLQRELEEETSLKLSMDNAAVVSQGYVDDPRNTDKAWMETVAAVKLLTKEEALQADPKEGSDAEAVKWARVESSLLTGLYASHAQLIRLAVEHLAASSSEQLLNVSAQLNEVRG